MNNKINNYLYQISAIIILLSAVAYAFIPEISSYVFSVAAAGFAISRLTQRYTGKNTRIKRLYNIQKLSAFAMLGASYFMFKPYNQWIIFLIIAGFIEFYTVTFISKETEKENKEK